MRTDALIDVPQQVVQIIRTRGKPESRRERWNDEAPRRKLAVPCSLLLALGACYDAGLEVTDTAGRTPSSSLALLSRQVEDAGPMPSAVQRIPGFTAEHSAMELELEERLKAIPDRDVIQGLARALTDHPNMAGTSGNYQSLHYTVEYLRSLGYRPEVTTYYPYLSMPEEVFVETLGDDPRVLRVKEQARPWQEHFADVVVGYNAYSPSGDITAEAVFANFGRPEDYELLEELGVDVRGKIVIVRYGRIYRGLKTKFAAERGALGVILYSDPASDGFLLGPVYPDGPNRSPEGIQRGTVADITEYPGDPLTPGVAATWHARRLHPSEASSLPADVPTTPLGYREASYILRAMGGQEAPANWQGGLSDPGWADYGGTPFVYHLGGTANCRVHLRIQLNNDIRPIWNVMVRIPGAKHPDEVVIVGAHRDAWTYGTGDDASGFVPVLELARALKIFEAQGVRPDRTILLAGWDAEEFAMIGSTEWGEQFREQLRGRAVAYINLDGGGDGNYIYTAGVPALDGLLYDVMRQVPSPQLARPGLSVYDDFVLERGSDPPGVYLEGAGTDFAVFLDHVGIPVADLGFWGDLGYYHSAEDDLYNMENFLDPGYRKFIATAQLAGVAALRLANADVLPFVYSKYASETEKYLTQLEARHASVGLDLSSEKQAARTWHQAALQLERNADALLEADLSTRPIARAWREHQLGIINRRLMRQERDLTSSSGLEERPWFKHVIYAASRSLGYDADVLPGLTDALTSGDTESLRRSQAALRQSLQAATEALVVGRTP